jgi:hypothetical protein
MKRSKQLSQLHTADLGNSPLIIVLGRGVWANGKLTEASEVRVRAVITFLHTVTHGHITVLFSTKCSWVQRDNLTELTRSEAEAMHALAQAELTDNPLRSDGVTYELLMENDSTDTVGNLVNSLGFTEGHSIVIVTDSLHYMFYRPQLICYFINGYKGAAFVSVPLTEHKDNSLGATLARLTSIIEEFMSTLAFLVAMTLVHRSPEPVMKRQKVIERLNRKLRKKGWLEVYNH